MANEASLRDRIEDPINFTVADGTGIEKGTLLKLTDPRTAIASTAKADPLAGILAREKVASDGRTIAAVYRRGIFDMLASGAITVGGAVQSASDANYPNAVMAAAVTSSGAQILGTALETATDGETIQIFVEVGASSKALS